MYKELYGYLILYKELTVPGIGTFLLNKQPAVVDFPNKLASPGTYSVSYSRGERTIDHDFFHRLGAILEKSANETSALFADFASRIAGIIRAGGEVRWKNVGGLSRALDGSVKFVPEEMVISQTPVHAEKVLRENAAHMVRVGEDERTSEQMTEFFSETGGRKNYRLLIAAAVAVLAFIFIAWHFSQHGLQATGNKSRSAPADSPAATYRQLSQP